MTIQELYQLYLLHPSIQTDTRKLKAGDLFFALSGPNFNGNAFAVKALEAGAAYAIVDEPVESNNPAIIRVADSLATLQQLAGYHRSQLSIPFIAITGSNGKTTTKELMHAVLSSHYITYTTQGNLNNHIGIPLTLLSIGFDAQMAVIEMGANHLKEIESYCVYTAPTHGIITNCGKAHLEGFGGIEGVRNGKGELYDYLRAHKGTAFIYADYPYLQSMSGGIKEVYRYGFSEGEVTGQVRLSEPFLEVQITKGLETALVKTKLVGDYNLPNVLCAVAVGRYFKVPDEKISRALETFTPSNSRSQLVQLDSNNIILDAYNANPSSMRAAIENFAKLHADKKILMLGGMMELGEESLQEHQQIISLIAQYQWNHVILVGGDFSKTKHPYTYFHNAAEAREWFLKQSFTHTHLLIKGSRSMQMEKILD